MPTTFNPDGSVNYIAPQVSGYFAPDLFNFGAPNAPSNQGPQRRPKMQQRVVETLPGIGSIVQWRIMVDDMRGGTNMSEGSFDETFDRDAGHPLAVLDGRFYRTLCLPFKKVTNQPAGGISTGRGNHSAFSLNRLWIGRGNAANASLFRETSATDSTLTAVTFTPSGIISCLATIVIGGATAAERLAVGFQSGGGIKLVDNVNGNVTDTMNAATTPAWGIIQGFDFETDKNTILIYMNGTISYLYSTSAAGAAPTSALTNVPDGGFALGLLKLNNAPIRAAWVWPFQSTSAGMYGSSSMTRGRVVTTNLAGFEPQDIDMGLPKGVRCAALVGSYGIVASDGERVMYYDGRTRPRDLRWLVGRFPASSVTTITVNGLFVNDSEIWVNAYGSSGFYSGAFWDVYDLQTDAWHRTATSTFIVDDTDMPVNTQPFSPNTRKMFFGVLGSGHELYVAPYGQNPYWQWRHTSDGVGSAKTFESFGYILLPAWELPGLEGAPKTVSRVTFLGDLGMSTENAAVSYYFFPPGVANDAGNVPISFANVPFAAFGGQLNAARDRSQAVDWGNNDPFYKLHMAITVGQDSTNNDTTPNALPFMVEGYAFVSNLTPPPSWVTDF